MSLSSIVQLPKPSIGLHSSRRPGPSLSSGRRSVATMAGKQDKTQFLKERFGAFSDPQNDEAAYGSAEEPLFGSRYTSHDMPKYE